MMLSLLVDGRMTGGISFSLPNSCSAHLAYMRSLVAVSDCVLSGAQFWNGTILSLVPGLTKIHPCLAWEQAGLDYGV